MVFNLLKVQDLGAEWVHKKKYGYEKRVEKEIVEGKVRCFKQKYHRTMNPLTRIFVDTNYITDSRVDHAHYLIRYSHMYMQQVMPRDFGGHCILMAILMANVKSMNENVNMKKNNRLTAT